MGLLALPLGSETKPVCISLVQYSPATGREPGMQEMISADFLSRLINEGRVEKLMMKDLSRLGVQ